MYNLELKFECNECNYEFLWKTTNFTFDEVVKEFEDELKKLGFDKDKAICLNCQIKELNNKSDIEILLWQVKDYWQQLPENINKKICDCNDEWNKMTIKELEDLIKKIRVDVCFKEGKI